MAKMRLARFAYITLTVTLFMSMLTGFFLVAAAVRSPVHTDPQHVVPWSNHGEIHYITKTQDSLLNIAFWIAFGSGLVLVGAKLLLRFAGIDLFPDNNKRDWHM